MSSGLMARILIQKQVRQPNEFFYMLPDTTIKRANGVRNNSTLTPPLQALLLNS